MVETDLPADLRISAAVFLTVPFRDADPAGVAWHGNYLRYFDEARCALLEKLGYTYRNMMDGGLYWPVVKVEIKYARPVTFDSRIKVVAELLEWQYRLKIKYDVFDAQDRRTTTGHTIQVAVSASTGEMYIGAPDILRERLRSHLARHGNEA